jgi:DNA-binding XRE family transcriptional regulator
VSGRHTFRKLRVKIERDPERRGLMGEKRKAYDVLLNLAELREAKGLTQAELAERLGVSQPNVSKLEAAAASPHAGPSTFDPQRVHCRPGQSPRGVGLLPRAPRGRRRRRRGLGWGTRYRASGRLRSPTGAACSASFRDFERPSRRPYSRQTPIIWLQRRPS